jgi:hypothetical protein
VFQETATIVKSAPYGPGSETKAPGGPEKARIVSNAKIVSEDEIRLLAYRKWVSAGRPQGNGIGFWLRAEQELSQAQ